MDPINFGNYFIRESSNNNNNNNQNNQNNNNNNNNNNQNMNNIMLNVNDRKYISGSARNFPQLSQEFPGSPVNTSTTSTSSSNLNQQRSQYKSPDIMHVRRVKSSNSSPSLTTPKHKKQLPSLPSSSSKNQPSSSSKDRKETSMSLSSTPNHHSTDYTPSMGMPSSYSLYQSPFSNMSSSPDQNMIFTSPSSMSSSSQQLTNPTSLNFRYNDNNKSHQPFIGTDILSQLPEEILITFLSFLSVSDLYWCTFVCKTWKRLCEDEYIFKKICHKSYPCLSKYIRPPFETSWRKYYNMRKSSFLVLGGPVAQSSCMDDICKKLRECGLDNVDSFYTQKRLPTLEELQKYTGVLIYSYNSSAFLDGQTMGDVLSDYVDNGGGVVVTVFTNCNNLRNGFLKGRFFDQNYHPINPARQADTNGKKPLTLGKVVIPNHPILNGIKSLDGGRSSFFCPGSVNSEANLVAEWSNGAPLIADLSKQNGKVVALNFFPPSSDTGDARFWSSDSGGAQMMANALAYVGRSSALRKTKSQSENGLTSSDRIKDHGEGASSLAEKDYNQNKQKEKKHKFLGKKLPFLYKLFSSSKRV
ncbi:hypothetical protein DFA_05256 [Cavenderia fasciculata]|uniref:RING-type E3 ubiquitin transferase n=1 Tax=Cavenderia fasciculata TaxID=261658 RepID=F4PNS3_CACFS|nr:uncharacterized protein DFA_05256 [Cavenderia fasciculata]EGG23126.1 hypothetical protein DFA_05256 [Cavenderia fasciculata]|eukprot:XP_004360977.1 hypothetical protein DFA_05256 [Cavenderia fasciculata]